MSPNFLYQIKAIMDMLSNGSPSTQTEYDRSKAAKAFDDTKAGVKGIVDAGIQTVPNIFILPSDEIADEIYSPSIESQVPVVDFNGVEGNKRKEIVDEIRIAAESWGFFQVVNHGVPISVLDEMITGICRFHEGDLEMKKEFYSRDMKRKVRFNSNYDLYLSKAANWRDTLIISFGDNRNIDPEELPEACRDSSIEYTKHVKELAKTLFELLAEALGLNPEHFEAMECASSGSFACHYYPASPEPKLTIGTRKHSDPAFLTILLQDQIGGLQVLNENHWVNVHPIPGALVVNIGDFLQVVSNDKFKSVDHRVVSQGVGPRISVACFFTASAASTERSFGPIKELLSENNPPLYRDFKVRDYLAKFLSRELDSKTGIDALKL